MYVPLALYLICIVVVSQPTIGLQTFNLCQPHYKKGEYFIPPPEPCLHKKHTAIHQCTAKIYDPSHRLIDIEVFVCRTFITTSIATHYFFGSKSHDDSTVAGPAPNPDACDLWRRTFQAPNVGELKQQNEFTWATRNKVKRSYSWPSTTTTRTINGILNKSILKYDPVTQKLMSSIATLSKCQVSSGSCIVGARTFIWKFKQSFQCPQTVLQGVHKLLLHYHKEHLYRVQIKALGISVHHRAKCAEKTFQCYSQNAICTPTGLILVPQNCSELAALDFYKPATIKQQSNDVHSRSSSSEAGALARFMTESNDNMADHVSNLVDDIHYLECQVETLVSSLYALVARQYPGETLTAISGQKKAAVTIGDLITEIQCYPVSGTVLRSLVYKGQFSARPLVEFFYNNGTKSLGQIYRDGNLYRGVRYVESYVPGRIFSFNIGNQFYQFENYSLSQIDSDVQALRPSFVPVNFTEPDIDFETFIDDYPSEEDQGFEDIQNMLVSMSHFKLAHDKFYHFLDANTDQTRDYDFSSVRHTIENTFSNVFLSVLSSITNPVLGGILVILLFMAMFWGFVLTIWAIKFYRGHVVDLARSLISRVRRIRQPAMEENVPPDDAPENREDLVVTQEVRHTDENPNEPLYPNLRQH
ncbi:uncharacterized protein LOC143471040 [Clavelina lepadiformis]|uniref:uncharacterized protein LOC143471040 n=1 Tax=Clavelina lepadiformis TaxID=159417 RepID=UPI0040425050